MRPGLGLKFAPLALALATVAGGHASEVVTCAASVGAAPSGHDSLRARFDLDTMSGTLAIDEDAAQRRFRVKAVPHSATYLLVFLGYGRGDRKPAAEKL